MFQDAIKSLGHEIEEKWRQRECRWQDMPAIAHAALSQRALHQQFDEMELLRWAMTTTRFPKQHAQSNAFGQPPLTLWYGNGFFIELYFWVTPDTAIHDHGFAGAFTNLSGRSLHARYDFAVSEEPCRGVRTGELKLRSFETLQPGSVIAIDGARKFIHQVWHLSRPTITLVVRTVSLESSEFVQFEYNSAGLAVRSDTEAWTQKRTRLIDYLYRSENPERDKLISEMIVGAEPWSAFQLLRAYSFSRRQRYFDSFDHFDQLVETMKGRHGAWIECFSRALRRHDLYRLIRWENLRAVEHRLFVALLLSTTTRRDLQARLEEYLPGRDLVQIVSESLRSIRDAQGWTLAFSDLHLGIVNQMTRGLDTEEVVRAVAEEFELDDEALEKLGPLIPRLREIELLKPIWSTSG